MRSVLAHFCGNFVEALFSLFPEIGLEKSKFLVLPSRLFLFVYIYIYIYIYILVLILFEVNYWEDVNNRRKLFDKFAKSKKFEPLIPTNWYTWTKTDLLSFKVFLTCCLFISIYTIILLSFL